ncbi:TPA: hypothetical protein QCX51_005591 [Bacillus mycoides]|nr:hypothetical protein [Bacillus mycoides]HDR7568220.1 hypothetical protein [Bacillus mycoides]
MATVKSLAKRLNKIQAVRTPDGIVILASDEHDVAEKIEKVRAKNIVVINCNIDPFCVICESHFEHCKCETRNDGTMHEKELEHWRKTNPKHYAMIMKHGIKEEKINPTEGLTKWVKGDILYTRPNANIKETHEQNLAGLSPVVRKVLTEGATTLH